MLLGQESLDPLLIAARELSLKKYRQEFRAKMVHAALIQDILQRTQGYAFPIREECPRSYRALVLQVVVAESAAARYVTDKGADNAAHNNSKDYVAFDTESLVQVASAINRPRNVLRREYQIKLITSNLRLL